VKDELPGPPGSQGNDERLQSWSRSIKHSTTCVTHVRQPKPLKMPAGDFPARVSNLHRYDRAGICHWLLSIGAIIV